MVVGKGEVMKEVPVIGKDDVAGKSREEHRNENYECEGNNGGGSDQYVAGSG